MSSIQTLKQDIAEDLQTLKSIDIDIIPAREYYIANFKGLALVFWSIYLAQLAACVPPLFLGLWEHSFDGYWHDAIIFKMFAGGFFGTTFMMLFFYGKVKHFVIFNHQIKSKLKTGDYLVHKAFQAAKLFYGIYIGLVFLATLMSNPDMTFFASLGAFILTAIISSILIEMEVTRIGSSALFTEISNFFDKDKPKLTT